MSGYLNFVIFTSLIALVTVSTIAQADEIVNNAASLPVHGGNVPVETTIAPAASHSLPTGTNQLSEPASKAGVIINPPATTLLPSLPTTIKPLVTEEKLVVTPTTIIPVSPVVHTAPVEKVSEKVITAPLTTLAPISNISTKDTAVSVVDSEHDLSNPVHKLCEYLKPICESLDKLQAKPLSKIQAQFKQIVQANGKLGSCFLEHYSFDPNLNSITKSELTTICNSKHLPPLAKGSYKSFQKCAAKFWDANMDKELDKVIAARINCLKNHKHSQNATTPVLSHEDEEFSLISEVVSKVLEGDSSSFNNNSDIKVIDVSSLGSTKSLPALPSVTVAPVKGIKATTVLPLPNGTNNLLNNENTVVVFVDDAKTTLAPLAVPAVKPIVAKDLKTTAIPVVKPLVKESTNSTTAVIGTEKPLIKDLKTTTAPILASKLTTKIAIAGTTLKPATVLPSIKSLLGTTIAPKEAKVESLAQKLISTVAPVTAKVSSSNSTKVHIGSTVVPLVSKTTLKPVIGSATTKKVDIVAKGTKAASLDGAIKVAKAKVGSTGKPVVVKPLETLEEILKRQEKEKQDLELKLKIEREKIMKQLQKKQDEIDAHNAMKALQSQRDASSDHTSDTRLHQIEHERQMSIDPVGHTLKHQQYEMNKQQKLMNGR